MLGFKSEEDARSAKAVLMTIALSQSAEDNRARAVVRFKKHDPVFFITLLCIMSFRAAYDVNSHL